MCLCLEDIEDSRGESDGEQRRERLKTNWPSDSSDLMIQK